MRSHCNIALQAQRDAKSRFSVQGVRCVSGLAFAFPSGHPVGCSSSGVAQLVRGTPVSLASLSLGSDPITVPGTPTATPFPEVLDTLQLLRRDMTSPLKNTGSSNTHGLMTAVHTEILPRPFHAQSQTSAAPDAQHSSPTRLAGFDGNLWPI